MRPLILVTSCHSYRDRGYEDTIRGTWAVACPCDYRFLLGEGKPLSPLRGDEWQLAVPDDYAHVTLKTVEGHRRALEEGYGFVFQCFLDTYVNARRMLNSGFEAWDYTGFFKGHDGDPPRVPDRKGRYAYACGGSGYWLSPRACEIVASTPIDIPDEQELALWAEDLWVGTALGRAEIFGHNDARYREPGIWYIENGNEILSAHLGRGTGNYRPEMMLQAHRQIVRRGL